MDRKRYPVYVIAHNPNSIAEMHAVLKAGVNGIEPDVQYNKHTNSLCIAHDAPSASDNPPSIDAYLHEVKKRLPEFPQLSLIYFDIKLDEPVYGNKKVSVWGKEFHNLVNDILGGSNLVILYSVAKVEQLGFFFDFALSLHPKEALMVDQESDVEHVINAFQPFIINGLSRIAYADGTSAFGIDLNIAQHIQKALFRRAMKNKPVFVCTWVLRSPETMLQYFRAGVDGMIVTDDSIEDALKTVQRKEFADHLRLAERQDNPFDNLMTNYAIEVVTLNRTNAGTDALVTCQLSGPTGPVAINIDSGKTGLFESGTTTQMVMKRPDAGTPVTIAFSHDGTGNAPEWLPDIVHVTDIKKGLHVSAGFGEWIGKGTVSLRELGSTNYTLQVHTSDVSSAGTDADIIFTIEGSKGTVKRRVNAYPVGLFERDDHNIVEMRGKDVGNILHLIVETDGSGNGPDWHLDKITVLVNNTVSKTFHFNQWIEGGNPVKK